MARKSGDIFSWLARDNARIAKERAKRERQQKRDEERAQDRAARQQQMFGTGETDPGHSSTAPTYAADEQGNAVTVSFGEGDDEGETYLADGYVKTNGEFWGKKNQKGHDHYGPGDGRNNNGTQRGKYTGYGS